MNRPSPPPPRGDAARRAGRWLLAGTGLVLAPKCVACLLAYAGFGAALGIVGPELCGAEDGSATGWTVLFTRVEAIGWPALLAVAAIGSGGGALIARRARGRGNC